MAKEWWNQDALEIQGFFIYKFNRPREVEAASSLVQVMCKSSLGIVLNPHQLARWQLAAMLRVMGSLPSHNLCPLQLPPPVTAHPC
jgi:hypothetical protein